MEDVQENLPPYTSSSSSSSSPNQQPVPIDEELWLMAEDRAQEILCTIQPNVVSEQNRKEVIDYVQSLIGGCYGTEVFPFGSVPLKTYLPDGDIDLTALTHENLEEDLAQAVCSILENSMDPEYPVKDVQYIRAQVQVVKCTVKNMAVDVSFNQMAGLSTLCFLEQVDQLAARNHLFKRSIILVKAWCYYESRILGAHHGLFSTYAVETLVLYIINLYHSSIRGPLELLYRFLDYYSTFEWDSYCVSINGPVPLSSFPDIVETPECAWDELLLSKEFMRNCMDIYSSHTCDTGVQEFPIKHLNILDPLRSKNNLGRSVSRGNCHRIRFALSFGARKLKEILAVPGQSMGAALENFFANTLERNGKGQRADVLVPVPAFGTGRSEESDLTGDYDSYYADLQYGQLYHSSPMLFAARSPSQADLYGWSAYYPVGTDVYIPTPTFFYTNSSQNPDGTCSIEETGKSRGTGTYIPDANLSSYRRPRRPVSSNHNGFPTSPQNKELEDTHSETDVNADLRSLEISEEGFPRLPTIDKTSTSEAQKSFQLTVKPESTRNSSSSHLKIEFGTYRDSQAPKDLHLPVKEERAGSGVSETQGSILGVPRKAKDDGKEELTGSDADADTDVGEEGRNRQ
ncbi:hypothetical protein L6164_030181 [Bauhinia variegata]|uniref:Uncharacterized protein n=1 Tax=Bauhinia variegata TaxID=167791 RepID=A0ACB9LCV0_BAUVA|nr:hypothetical protein L6164_030181 [Bauhinia variegata]